MLITLYKGLFVSNYPNYIRNMFTFRSSKYNLRGNNILDLPKRNTTTYGLHSFTYLTAKLWNSLPDNLRTSKSLNEFKRNIFSVTNLCMYE